jgi:hypothetical protein
MTSSSRLTLDSVWATGYKDYGGVDHEHTRDTHTHGNIAGDTLDLVTGPDYKRRNTEATTPGLPFQRPRHTNFRQTSCGHFLFLIHAGLDSHLSLPGFSMARERSRHTVSISVFVFVLPLV